jgi:predicted DNA-binding ribbon-helix-helix protein
MQPLTPRKSRLVNRSVIAAARRTSIRLEPEFWHALDQISEREKVDRNELIRRVENAAPEGVRTSAVRVFVLEYFRDRERAAEHRAALPAIGLPVTTNGANPHDSERRLD